MAFVQIPSKFMQSKFWQHIAETIKIDGEDQCVCTEHEVKDNCNNIAIAFSRALSEMESI